MLKLLKKFTKREWFLSFIALLLIIVEVWLELKMPDYMSQITRLVQTEGSKMADIIANGAWMIGCAFGSLIAAIIVGYIVANVAAAFSMQLRKNVFNKVESLSMNEIKQFKTNSLITRTTNDITQIEMVISMGLQLLLKAPITATWAILKILNKSWQWSVATAVAVVILLSVIGMLTIIVMPRFKIVQKLIDKINGVTRENLTGIRVVRAFNAENYQQNKFDNANDELTSTYSFTAKLMALMSPVMTLIMSGLSLSIYFIGAYLIERASMMDKIGLFSDMVVFSAYAMQVVIAFMMLTMIFILYPRASVAGKRIMEILDTESSIKSGEVTSSKETGTIEFKNVSFKYPDAEEYMLENISFKVKKGQTIAFIGRTGSGKSTIINLIPRFYDATSGEVLVDGINVKEYKEESLYDKIGYVSQKAIMFRGTISENISFGKKNNKKIPKENISKAINVAQAEEFISKIPERYNFKLAEGGTNLSGGQKQRLSIARAIARNPEIYIFDDSFSALDYKTDFTLRKQLKNYVKDATVLIVAQRIGTIKNADKIIVLENGEVAGEGTHKELLSTCAVYKDIVTSQLSSEEGSDD